MKTQYASETHFNKKKLNLTKLSNGITHKKSVNIHYYSQNGCVVFYIKCVIPKLYESNWCAIGETPNSSHKNSIKFFYRNSNLAVIRLYNINATIVVTYSIELLTKLNNKSTGVGDWHSKTKMSFNKITFKINLILALCTELKCQKIPFN